MLIVEKINTYYGYSHILHDVSLEVRQGEIAVLLGSNGVGKTTTLNRSWGSGRPGRPDRLQGEGDYAHAPRSGRPPRDFPDPGGSAGLPNLTVYENLKLGMLIRDKGLNIKVTSSRLSLLPKAEKRRNQVGGSLSGGEQQMLTTARGMVAQPKLMLIDEPTEGLAPFLWRRSGR